MTTTIHPITPEQLSSALTDHTRLHVLVNGVLHEVYATQGTERALVLEVAPLGAGNALLAAGWFVTGQHLTGEASMVVWNHPAAPNAAAPTWWAYANIATPELCEPRENPQPGWYPGQWQPLARVQQVEALEHFTHEDDLRDLMTQYAGYMRGVGVMPEDVRGLFVLRRHGEPTLILASTEDDDNEFDPVKPVTVVFNSGHPWGPDY